MAMILNCQHGVMLPPRIHWILATLEAMQQSGHVAVRCSFFIGCCEDYIGHQYLRAQLHIAQSWGYVAPYDPTNGVDPAWRLTRLGRLSLRHSFELSTACPWTNDFEPF